MDDRNRSQIALIVGHEVDLAARAIEKQREAIFAKNSHGRILATGATIKQVIDAVGATAEALLQKLLSQCGAISRDPATFEQIAAGIENYFGGIETTMTRLAHVTGGAKAPSTVTTARELLNQSKSDIAIKLAIEKFGFNANDGDSSTSAPVANAPIPKSRGAKALAGRLPADWWDDLWVEIFRQIYEGDLQPKTQADISRAMLQWLSDQGIDVAESTVKPRARKLMIMLERANG